MKPAEIIQAYETAIATQQIRSPLDVTSFLNLLKAQHRATLAPDKDFEQSWRGVKGSALERLTEHILAKALVNTPLSLVSDKHITPKSVYESLYTQLLINYGVSGRHLPDADLVVYRAQPIPRAIAILSIKASLRERIAQVAYWRSKVTIPYYFITTDDDADFLRELANKPRAIAEQDTSGVYLLSDRDPAPTALIKPLAQLIPDLLALE